MSSKDILLDELKHWPDVDYEIESGGRHSKIRFVYHNCSKFLTFSTTKVDRRGMLNQRAVMRKLLAAMGASRR